MSALTVNNEREKMRSFWFTVGVLLLGWVAWDLYAGYTLLWDFVYRETQPGLYWICVSVWAVLGISCFFSWE